VETGGNWPTPLATRRHARGSNSRGGRVLEEEIRNWPTPLATDTHAKEYMRGNPNLARAIENWPTPTTRDMADAARATTSTEEWGAMHPGWTMLDRVREHSLPPPTGHPTEAPTPTPGERGSPDALVVNPVFVEALMGLPADWTRADDEPASLALAMPQSRDKPQRRSRSSSSEEPSK
jgi:hypothetical protein